MELDPESMTVLAEHHGIAEARAREAGIDLLDGALVLSRCADGASPWLPNWTTKEFMRVRRRAGLPPFRLHDLRHFMATVDILVCDDGGSREIADFIAAKSDSPGSVYFIHAKAFRRPPQEVGYITSRGLCASRQEP